MRETFLNIAVNNFDIRSEEPIEYGFELFDAETNDLVGAATVLEDYEGSSYVLDKLMVQPPYLRQGYGSNLISQIKDWLELVNPESYVLRCNPTPLKNIKSGNAVAFCPNKKGLKDFYKKNEFNPDKEWADMMVYKSENN